MRLLPHLREKLNRQIEKSALGAEKMVPQVSLEGDLGSNLDEGVESTGGNAEFLDEGSDLILTKWLECAIMERCTLVGLENNLSPEEQSRRVILGEKRLSSGEAVDFGERVVLVLGEEVHGIPAEVREKLQYFLEIPMRGRKESFNVSVATGIALWGLANLY